MSYPYFLRAISTDKSADDPLLIPIVGNPECTEELTTPLRKISDGSFVWFTSYPLTPAEYMRAQSVSSPTLLIEVGERELLEPGLPEWLESNGYEIVPEIEQ